MRDIAYAVKFGAEVSRDVAARAYHSDLPEAFKHKYGMSFISSIALARGFYDLASPEVTNGKARQRAGKYGGQILYITNIMDDAIDTPPQPPNDVSRQWLDEWQSVLVHGRPAAQPQAPAEITAYCGKLHEEFVREAPEVYAQAFRMLCDDVINYMDEKDPEALLTMEKTIGAGCADLAAAATDIVAGAEHPDSRQACRALGAYAQILDTIADTDENLAEGISTSATATLAREGDEPLVRQAIATRLLDEASDVARSGYQYLEGRQQKSVYSGIKRLLSLRYRRAFKMSG